MFEQGMKLDAVWWNAGNGQEGYHVTGSTGGLGGLADSITVEMVSGHMANLPWAKVLVGGKTVMVNLFQCNDVHIADQKGGQS